MPGYDVPALVEAHLGTVFGAASGRGSVTFVGAESVTVLRFGPDHEDVERYCSVGMSARPMADPLDTAVDPVGGPRAELVLSVRGRRDGVLRGLAVLAASPAVEGVVVAPGASLDLGEPLWAGAGFFAVLVGSPGGLVPDLQLEAPYDDVRFLPLLPMTPAEAAWKRVHGAEALEERWLRDGVDLRDPHRKAAW